MSPPVSLRPKSEKSTHTPLESCRAALVELRRASVGIQLSVAGLFLLLLLMLPMGRSGSLDILNTPVSHWGILAPLCADSGSPYLSLYRRGLDFFSIYDAGADVLAGHDPYDPRVPTSRAPDATAFRYPPTALVLLSIPLNILPPIPAYWLWVALLVAMAVGNFLLCSGRRPECMLLFALLFFGAFPMIAEFHLGQFSFFVGTMMLWGVDGLMTSRSRWGVAWALACFTKLYPIGFAASLFLWSRKGLALGTAAVLAGAMLGWALLGPPAYRENALSRDFGSAGGAQLAVPYAGAQGVQAMINAGVWKLVLDRSLAPAMADGYPAPAHDPVRILGGAVVLLYGAICLWALVRTRHGFSLSALGIFWMAWFFVIRDCWEHHYLMFLPLVALLLAHRIIGWRIALWCWLCCGAPSLWLLWEKTGYSGDFTTELIGTAYFFQRPWGPIVLAAFLCRDIITAKTEKV